MSTTIPTSRQRRRSRSHNARIHHRRWWGWVALAAVVAVAVALVLAAGRSSTTDAVGAPAPRFTMPSTDGRTVSLDDYRGRDVLLYFNEGVGCDVCFDQVVQIERAGVFDGTDLTLLPIVVNDLDSVQAELERFGIETPFLIDPTKEFAAAYRTLGTGHHADLPGHSFVLVDGRGRIAWRGDYPSMWVDPTDLARDVAAAR